MSQHQDYWDDFYASDRSTDVPRDPSPFARWSAERLPAGARIADLGCGTARDAVWLAAQGFRVAAFDYSPAAVTLARHRAEESGVAMKVADVDLYDAEQVEALARTLRADPAPIAVYGRFLLHALEPEGQRAVCELAADVAGDGGMLLLEFRTGRDQLAPHEFGEHYRSFPDPDEVVAALTATGATVAEREEGHGLARYRSEDPHVARLRVCW